MVNARYCQVSTKNGLFLIDKNDHVISKQLLESGEWAPEELTRILSYVSDSSRVLIVGAHIGTLVIPISKHVAKVVAIEANPETFKLLEQNILLNSSENCTAYCIAANNKSEKLSFLINTDNSGGSKRKPKIMKSIYTYDNPEEVLVDAAPLDTFLEDHSFDLIVMDIEGSEYYALQGMSQILENVRILIIEFVPHHLKNVSGVTVSHFSTLFESFDTLYCPSTQLTVSRNDFLSVLSYLYENDIADEGLVFSKSALKSNS